MFVYRLKSTSVCYLLEGGMGSEKASKAGSGVRAQAKRRSRGSRHASTDTTLPGTTPLESKSAPFSDNSIRSEKGEVPEATGLRPEQKPATEKKGNDDRGDVIDILDQTEKELRIEKLLLENGKLQREKKLSARVLEWIRALAVPVPVLALVVSVWLGIRNIDQAQQEAAEARLDTYVVRTLSPDADDRMAGVAGLSRFLQDEDNQRQIVAIRSLINALATEADLRVATSIFSYMEDLEPTLSLTAIEDGLAGLIDTNRRLRAAATEIYSREFGNVAVSEDLAEIARGLQYTGQAIPILLSKTEAIKDLSGIYCYKCDFSFNLATAAHLVFDEAELIATDFSHSDLTGSSFREASLGGVVFSGALLVDVDFSGGVLGGRWSVPARFSEGLSDGWPLFHCADLRGANFGDRVVVSGSISVGADTITMYAGPIGIASAIIDHSTRMDASLMQWTVAYESRDRAFVEGLMPFAMLPIRYPRVTADSWNTAGGVFDLIVPLLPDEGAERDAATFASFAKIMRLGGIMESSLGQSLTEIPHIDPAENRGMWTDELGAYFRIPSIDCTSEYNRYAGSAFVSLVLPR